jgi:hypothetical protein
MSDSIKYTILPSGRLKCVNNGMEHDHYGYEYMLASDYATMEAEIQRLKEETRWAMELALKLINRLNDIEASVFYEEEERAHAWLAANRKEEG